jgi:hypothetical protein
MRAWTTRPSSMTLEDAEWIASPQVERRLKSADCSACHQPLLATSDTATTPTPPSYSGNSSPLSLRRHLLAWEQAISRQLLTEAGRRIYFAEHGLEGLLRGDSATRAAFYHDAISDGWMTVDEVRQLENLPCRQIGAAA